jgi:hypothetical protein
MVECHARAAMVGIIEPVRTDSDPRQLASYTFELGLRPNAADTDNCIVSSPPDRPHAVAIAEYPVLGVGVAAVRSFIDQC